MSVLSRNCNYIEKHIQMLSGLSTLDIHDEGAIQSINRFADELKKYIEIYYPNGTKTKTTYS